MRRRSLLYFANFACVMDEHTGLYAALSIATTLIRPNLMPLAREEELRGESKKRYLMGQWCCSAFHG